MKINKIILISFASISLFLSISCASQDLSHPTIESKAPIQCKTITINVVKPLPANVNTGIQSKIDEELKKELFNCRYSNFNKIVVLVEKGGNPNLRISYNDTPIICAIENGTLVHVKRLLEKGAEVNLPGTFNKTPLHIATENFQIDKVKLLLENGADPNAKGEREETPLMDMKNFNDLDPKYYIIQTKIAELLIAYGADVNGKGSRDEAPIIQHAWDDNAELVKLLIDNGADVDVKGEYLDTALHKALFFGNYSVARELIKAGAYVKAKNIDGETTLDKVCSGMHLDMSVYSYEDQYELAKILIDKGVDVNSPGGRGKNNPLIQAVGAGNLKLVELLIQKGADVNAANHLGNPPMCYIAQNFSLKGLQVPGKTQVDIAKLLIKNGALVDKRVFMEMLHNNEKLHPDVLYYLLEINPNLGSKEEVNQKNNNY